MVAEKVKAETQFTLALLASTQRLRQPDDLAVVVTEMGPLFQQQQTKAANDNPLMSTVSP